ncbi:unnamed protein product [Rotaria sp. Silwood1]|nr:unnamed protein product [Rotaria sp. Silwood1]CAF3351862.1 unnamed protein product [Rotaria sp. Silwood1]CAF4827616.1 unnamed protein product [Rotaria sp. Silwood1]CAF4951003.1 unnamed protein product [Rotaria sp. Silwood1]
MPTLDNMLTVCYGCRQLIDDRYYLMAVDRSWHLSCLKCFDCGMSLEQERTCFARYGQIFCKDDYIKRYCSRVCTRCHTIIRQDEVILRAKQFIFHLDCFTCVTCNILLHPGDEFGLKDDLIYCRHHFFEQQQSYETHLTGRVIDIGIENASLSHTNSVPTGFLDDSGYYTSPIPTLIPSTPPTNTNQSTGTTINITKRTRKRKERQQHHDIMPSSDHFLTLSPSSSNMVGNDGSLFTPSLDSSYYVDVVDMDGNSTNNNSLHSHQTNNNNNNNLSSGSHHHHHHTRQKRVRTSFKHHQLRCMRSYFNLNHNPDAKDLKNLAEKTNLPKRVLQVWFQNARAKYRRSVSRSDTLSSTSQHSSIPQQQQQQQQQQQTQQQSQINQTSLTMTNMIDVHPTREDTTNSSNLSSPTESIRSKTSSVNFSESETYGSM